MHETQAVFMSLSPRQPAHDLALPPKPPGAPYGAISQASAASDRWYRRRDSASAAASNIPPSLPCYPSHTSPTRTTGSHFRPDCLALSSSFLPSCPQALSAAVCMLLSVLTPKNCTSRMPRRTPRRSRGGCSKVAGMGLGGGGGAVGARGAQPPREVSFMKKRWMAEGMVRAL